MVAVNVRCERVLGLVVAPLIICLSPAIIVVALTSSNDIIARVHTIRRYGIQEAGREEGGAS